MRRPTKTKALTIRCWPSPNEERWNSLIAPWSSLDLETTGLDPLIHEVIDIGAVRVDQATLEIEATFSAKIQPLHIELASPIALEVNGYTPEAWKHAVNQSDGWRSFFSFARQSVFASYSTRFDWGFTNEALRFDYPNQEADRSRKSTVHSSGT